MALRDRYEGKPILIIIENYVLVVIGELSPEDTADVAGIVRKVWKGGADWMSTVRRELALDASFDDAIVKNWQAYRKAAKRQKKEASAIEFAKLFADTLEEQAHAD
jgi:hypothetical protein